MQKEWEVVEKAQLLHKGFTRRFMYENYCKKIDAFLKLNNLSLDKEKEYFEKYTEEEFDDLIKKHYDIKGDITWKSILNAKVKKNEKEETEHEIQVKVCKYLSSKKLKYFAVPNGFVRGGSDKLANARYVNYMKAEGVRNGVFDLVILLGCGKIAFLELKTKKGKPSEHQLEWKDYFDSEFYNNAICYGYEEAKNFIDNLLNL